MGDILWIFCFEMFFPVFCDLLRTVRILVFLAMAEIKFSPLV